MISGPKERIYLRALEATDVERTFRWHNDAALYRTLSNPYRPVSKLTEEEWLRKASNWSATALNLAICLTENNRHIGNVYLRDIDWVSRRAELHLFIAEVRQRHKGYAQAAVHLAANYAFRELGLRRIHLQVLAENEPAVRAYEKCGFVREGCLRKHVFKDGQFKDLLLMGLNV